jgi:Fe-S-cluster containining protein
MDLEEFKVKAEARREDLEGFLKKLDTTVPRGFSRIVAEEDAEVWKDVDCTTCANCCKTMTPVFTKADIKRISTHLRMSPKAFFDKWLEVEEDTGSTINSVQPCQFLVDDKCSIYEVRPKDCAEFPHHNKKPFDLYNDTFIQNVHRCPATYNLIERLKARVEAEYEW